MFDFIRSVIKTAIAVIAGGIVAIGGFFSYHETEGPVAGTAANTPAVVHPIELSPEEEMAAIFQASSAATAAKPAAPAPKPKPATNPVQASQPVAATSSAAAQQQIQQPVQTTNSLPPQNEIDPETLVGILCYFNALITNPIDNSVLGGGEVLTRGSGVIVNSKGYILTNRHVVVQDSSNISIGEIGIAGVLKYYLDHCEVGQLPKGTHIPTISEIRAINPLTRIPVLGYSAQAVYDSSELHLGNLESRYADFAILKITGVSKDGPSFGINSLPASFPYAKLLPVTGYEMKRQEVVTYGFPGDVTVGQKESFQTMTMTGSVGNVSGIASGDDYFLNMPLVIYTNMEVSQGRSGSPLFWRGYVIGLATFYIGENRTTSGSVASDAIIKGLGVTEYLGQ
ncbi:MAG: trypsin-like peptidase domain-containing protein [Candidatus Liptonbacteria bacterium]|nr:trypsin-like peptidase domain-containing protein [Candidatus Liptonbacteria bacterium]